MITANARTDETGRAVSGEFQAGLKTVPLYGERRDPWSVRVKREKKCCLGDLLGTKYDLLAHYLENQGVSLLAECTAGRDGIIRSVICNGTEYRSSSAEIFTRNQNK